MAEKIYLKLITKNNNKHPKCDDIIAAFYYHFELDKFCYVNFKHGDLPVESTFESFSSWLKQKQYKVYVNNKKWYKYWISGELVDINIFGFIKNNEIIENKPEVCDVYMSMRLGDVNDYNLVIPYVTHQSKFNKEVSEIKSLFEKNDQSYCFKFFNNIVTDTLYEVEKNGLKVDESTFNQHFDARTYDGYVYTDYHIYNPTGRPSNCYDGVNYAALKKDDGSRASFVSRYDNGYLIMVDFTGFHPYLVANLVGYTVPEEETIYEHLAKKYYNIDVVDEEVLKKSKKLTMFNLYGEISKQYLNIDFFKKVELLKNEYWKSFLEHGYVKTPIYKRKITNKHVLDPNKNKLFAYLIQAMETEHGMDRLSACIKYVKNKNILPILYSYDAILFDVGNVHQSDIDDLINIIKNKKFKVKVYKGENYNNLVQI